MSGKKIIWIIVILVVILVGYRIMASKKKATTIETDTSVPVYVQKVARGSIKNTIEVSGNIAASQQADIFSRVPGKLIKNLVDEGDVVVVNQEIALIDRDEVGVSFTTATVKSTIGGILLKRYIDTGSKVNPSMPIATVGDIRKVKAVINISESDFTRIEKGMRAYVKVDSYPDRKFSGEVVLVSPSIDLMSRTGEVEISVDNAGHELKPGMFASVELVLSVHSGIIVVPLDSLIEEGDLKKAFVVENSKAVERIISMGMADDSSMEVLKGLKDGEELIVSGQHKVKNGDTVKIVTE